MELGVDEEKAVKGEEAKTDCACACDEADVWGANGTGTRSKERTWDEGS